MIEVFKNDISCVTLMNINLLETAVTSVPNIPLEKSYAWWVKDNTISGSYFQTAVSPIFTYANFAKTAELGIRPLLHLHSYSKEKFKNIKPGEKAFISRISDEFHPLFFTAINDHMLFCDDIIAAGKYLSSDKMNEFLNSEEFINYHLFGEEN